MKSLVTTRAGLLGLAVAAIAAFSLTAMGQASAATTPQSSGNSSSQPSHVYNWLGYGGGYGGYGGGYGGYGGWYRWCPYYLSIGPYYGNWWMYYQCLRMYGSGGGWGGWI